MVGVVDDNIVQEDEVLARRAAAHVDAGRVVTGGLHPRKQLDASHQIRLPHRRDARKFGDSDAKAAHGGDVGGGHAFGHGFDAVDFDRGRIEFHVVMDGFVRRQVDSLGFGLVADVAERDAVLPGWEPADDVIPGLIRGGANVQAVYHHACIGQRFSARRIPNGAANGTRIALRQCAGSE